MGNSMETKLMLIYRHGDDQCFMKQEGLLCKTTAQALLESKPAEIPPSMSCCVYEEGKPCDFSKISDEKFRAIGGPWKTALRSMIGKINKKLEDVAPISYQCSPSSEARYLPATAVPSFDLRNFATLVQQCPDVRIKIDDRDVYLELGLNLAVNDFPTVKFLNISNSPNRADIIFSSAGMTFVLIDDPKQGEWNVQSDNTEAERAQALQNQFDQFHGGGCGAHLGGRP